MHSSRMHTSHSLTVCHSLLLRGGLDLIPLKFPLGCGPGSDPPQFPPWMWPGSEGHPPEQTHSPGSRHPSGADTPRSRHPPGADTPLGADTPSPQKQTPPQQTPPRSRHPLEQTHPWSRHTPLEQTPQSRHPPGDLLQGMLGYHLQCMLG